MEVESVLTQYLQQINGDYGQLKYFLSSNAVVDWFGRSIRGSSRILEFYRYEVNNTYEHIEFQKAEECSAIEFKPTHLKTKIFEEKDDEAGENSKNCTHGITSLKLFAASDGDDDDDDDDTDDDEVECITVEEDDDDNDGDGNNDVSSNGIAFEKLDDSIIEELSPSSSTIKIDITEGSDSDDSDDETIEIVAKRAKLMPYTSHAKRIPKTTYVTKRSDLTAYLEGINDKAKKEDDETTTTYSSLHYLETFGRFKLRCEEHSGYNARRAERDIRLRISYRKRISDQQIQIALIIYEEMDIKPATIKTRRNLFAEFSAVAKAHKHGNNDDDSDDSDLDNGHPAIIINSSDQRVIATVEATTTDEIAAALESAEFCIAPLRTPTKVLPTSMNTPKRKPRPMRPITSVKRSAARSLRL